MTDEIVSFEPATGKEIWRGAIGDPDREVERAQKAFREWAGSPLANRIELCRRFANVVRRDSEALTNLIANETGKPVWEARHEVEAVIGRVETSVKAYAERTAKRRLDSALSGTVAIRHKPHGVMAVVTPFNAPAVLPCGHILPALIAGNTIVFKPSEKAPATGDTIVRMMHEAGVPEDVVRLLVGGPKTGHALIAHDGVDGVLFTGSAHNGIHVNRKLAVQPSKIAALEMGGNNPIILWDTPLIQDAVTLIVQAAFTSAGQRCAAARRLIIKDEHYDIVVPEIKALTNRLIVGMPHDDPQPFMGPLIDSEATDGLSDSFVYLLSNGGKVINNLAQPVKGRPFMRPGIIDVTEVQNRPDMELFGPLLQIIRVSDFEEAIAEANNTRFGLTASLIGGTPEHYNYFWAMVKAGLINWNRPNNGGGRGAPFGGVGISGNHRPGAYYAADYCAYPVTSAEMDQPRAVLGLGVEQVKATDYDRVIS